MPTLAHFLHRWCDIYVNPNNVPVLEGVNTEICEQRFVHINRYAPALRHMNETRFKWMLQEVVVVDHEFRSLGLLESRVA